MENGPVGNSQKTEPNEGLDLNGDNVTVQNGAVRTINATNATVRQGGLQSAHTETLTVRQGGIVNARTTSLEMIQGAIGFAKTDDAKLTASNVGGMLAAGNVMLDQTMTRVLVSGGEVKMDQSAAAILIANNVNTGGGSGTVFLFARKVDGNVTTLFGPRESLVFGAVAGLVAGVLMLLGGLFRLKRTGHK